MDAFDILLQGLRRIPGIDNDWDRLIYPFKGSFEDDQKRFLGIPDAERIVYVRIIDADKTVPCSLAITNRGIYYRMINKFFWATVQDKKFNIQFKDVDEVKYSEREDSFIFSDGSHLGRHALVKKLENRYRFEFAEILTKATKAVLGVIDYFNKGISLMDDDKEEAALEEFNKALETGSKDKDFIESDERAYVYFYKGRCLMLLNQDDEAKTNLIIAKEISSKSSDVEIKDLLPAINANLAHVVDSRIESHKLLVDAYDKVKDSDAKKDLLDSLKSLHKSENFKTDFISHNRLAERKVVIVVRDNTTPIPGKSLLCLERNVVKSLGMSFPLSHPVDGCVYLAHPTRHNYYMPAPKYDEAIFLEKVNEYCYLLQCLGAKEIKIQKVSGKTLDEMNESKVDVGASFGRKSVGIDGNVNYRSQHHSNSKDTYEFKSYMTFKPTHKPYVPDDLNWLAVEPKWKRLIDNRLNGSLTHFIEEISTSEDKLLSNTEEISVNLEIKALITKFKGNVNSESSVSSSSKQATTWRIEVIF